ncbi:MAG: HAD family hydrolase [Candidatus Anstonellaceae archaeon]
MKQKLRRAVFLDRDGTLNKMVYYPDHGIVDSPFVPSQLGLLPGVPEALKILRRKGFMLMLVSNQPGVAKGNMGEKDFVAVCNRFDSLLAKHGIELDAKYYCMHHPGSKLAKYRKNCRCRKPKAGLLLAAAREHGIDLKSSYMAGDGIVDVKAGHAAGCKTVFIGAFKPELWQYLKGGKKPEIIAKSILDAAKKMK